MIANSKVNDGRQNCAHPDGQVVRVNAERVPVRADPTPELFNFRQLPGLLIWPDRKRESGFTDRCVPIHEASILAYKKEDERWDCWKAEADHAIQPQILAESRRIE